MRPVIYSLDELSSLFHERKVLTKEQIISVIGCSSMTLWRILKEVGYLTSYNCNARYYTLVDIPHFDENGLWSYRTVRFSTHGSLPKTVTALITQSVSGLTMADLRDLLQVNVTPTLLRLYKRGEISRQKVGPVYLYLSRDASERERQLVKYRQLQQAERVRQALPDPARIIAVLVELVKSVDLEPAQVYRRLRSRGISITKAEIDRIWLHYDLSKKKHF